jgi:hypothetical protein
MNVEGMLAWRQILEIESNGNSACAGWRECRCPDGLTVRIFEGDDD